MTVQVHLHTYYPADIENGLLVRVAQQAWETGANKLARPPVQRLRKRKTMEVFL